LTRDDGDLPIENNHSVTFTLAEQELISNYRVEPLFHRGLKSSLAKPSESLLILPSHKKAEH
jgi:hypothetical protein